MMNAIQWVSVVVPAYNAERTIKAMIDSVLSQSFRDLELIICDDASTDETVAEICEFDDPRIRLLRNEVNMGEGRTRDRAIAAAGGQWLAVVDADDAWEPHRLERLLSAAGNRTACMVFDDLMICHDTPRGLVPWRALRGPKAFGKRYQQAGVVEFESFIRSERLLIKPLMPRDAVLGSGVQHSQRRFAADTEYFVRLAHAGLSMVYAPEPLYLYRVTPGSATGVATGVHLMRDCIEECADLDWDDPCVRDAFRWKIDTLRANEALYRLAASVRRADLVDGVRVIARNPRILRALPRRAARHFAYQIHRLFHSGRAR